MSNFIGLQHGETRRRIMNVGGTEVTRKEFYCRLHGWIDAFLVGNDAGFAAKHGECGCKPKGAPFERVMKAAA